MVRFYSGLVVLACAALEVVGFEPESEMRK